MSCRWCYVSINSANKSYTPCTAISSERRAKLRDWAIWPVRANCYTQAALSSNDSKTLYVVGSNQFNYDRNWA